MYKLSKHAYLNIIQLVLDILFLYLSYFISYHIASKITILHSHANYLWIIIVFIPLWLFPMDYLGMYDKTTFCYIDRIIRNCLISTLAASVISASMTIFVKEIMVSKTLLITYVIIVIPVLVLERLTYTFIFIKKMKNSNIATKIIIVGSPDTAAKYKNYIEKTNFPVNIIGYIRVNTKEAIKSLIDDLGHIDELPLILKRNVVDEVIFTLPKDYVGKVEPYIVLCERMGITVRMVLNLYDLKLCKTHVTTIGTFPMLTFHTVSLNPTQMLLKRLMDIVGASIGLVVTFLLSIFIIPFIKLDSRGPVIFSQDRVGLNGRVFKLYKFRSMSRDADLKKRHLSMLNQLDTSFMFKIKDDPRVTKVGGFLRRTSLDELPQFLNVLKGDMSLVGTRPPTLDEVNEYMDYHHRRISIKPGITGLWQTSGRSGIRDFDEVVKLDTRYIDEWSLLLDIKIMFKTILIVIKRSNAY
ncbi:MAG: sugar transferase [Clostridium sp.]|nr:sugar transferase [Clostridium sp.]